MATGITVPIFQMRAGVLFVWSLVAAGLTVDTDPHWLLKPTPTGLSFSVEEVGWRIWKRWKFPYFPTT